MVDEITNFPKPGRPKRIKKRVGELEREWRKFETIVLDGMELPDEAKKVFKVAFYSGAQCMFHGIKYAGKEADEFLGSLEQG